nr:immunoglobulin light chain junction region [Macaca mulatta]MPN65448.1 immunoglobulin light chain junction region [Macaca mulatta]MPN65480.1 immunoglobulin light chain junction region [Macaca mulatta]MPN65486.1 immunoglobulin light chain junction region [Macaca mulatta]MPN65509.1 immunoglobulin light chain junction region [Macaca mulatta]
CAIGDSSGDVF